MGHVGLKEQGPYHLAQRNMRGEMVVTSRTAIKQYSPNVRKSAVFMIILKVILVSWVPFHAQSGSHVP
jgi:hypothetical protein